MLAALLTLANATAPAVPSQPPEFGWRCYSGFDIDGEPAVIWRDFDLRENSNVYFIQTRGPTAHDTYWRIDVRPDGPPASEKRSWNTGRSEADVLRDGPDYVHIDYRWRTKVVGPVFAYFWGDGRYAGAELLFTAGNVRRFTERDGTMGGLSGGLMLGEISRKLYGSSAWAFKAVDATGKVLAEGSFRPPDLARSVSAYRVSRAEIERLDAAYRGDFVERTVSGTSCKAHEDPDVL